jgi:hypothetical protein
MQERAGGFMRPNRIERHSLHDPARERLAAAIAHPNHFTSPHIVADA